MAEGTYEFECMRAELLGVDKPDQEEFEKARQERLVQEQAELEAAQANLVEEQDESLKNAGGKLDELNSILSSTQQKLNRFKQTACGSLSNIFGRGSIDLTADAAQMAAASSSTSSRRNTTASGGGEANRTSTAAAGIDEALDNLDEMQQQNTDNDVQPIISTEKIRNARLDIQKKMVSHLDKLDSLINQADQAEIAMTEQTKQMKKFTK